VVQNAKILDLNISRICENALLQAIEEEEQPYGITETSQIILEAELLFNIREKILAIHFTVINASDENVILDRINYLVAITDREYFSDNPDRQSIQMFRGTFLERDTIRKGDRRSFSEPLLPSSTLAKRLSEVTYEDKRNLRWIVYPDLIVDSKKRVLHAKYEQIHDKKRSLFAVPRLLKTF
jgi:hypothetical protein